MTSAQLHTNTGSGTVISGIPTVVSYLKESFGNYENLLSQALSDTVVQETAILRQNLAQHPDWADKVDNASVKVSEGFFDYSVEHPDAMDLEYGNPTTKTIATGTLRSVAKNREYGANKSLMDNLSRRLSNA